MFHPVGAQPPSVYWRRRLVVVASVVLLIVLIVLTANALGGSGGSASANSTAPRSSTAPTSQGSAPSDSSPAATSSAHSTGKSSGSSASRPASTKPVAACTAKSLDVVAVVGKPAYKVGQDVLLQMQVTNVGTQPCVQDLADKQVELRVYNGESRVWGSHDCKVQPGATLRTLAPQAPVKVAINWTGLSSQKGCKTRQQVGAGSYTLYTLLAGHMGKAAQFSIS